MPARPCLGYPGHPCPRLTRGARCPDCAARAGRPTYNHAWSTISRQAIADHRATHGDTCPGWDTPPHPIQPSEWTTDHELGPLCRGCNGRKGATVDKQRIQNG